MQPIFQSRDMNDSDLRVEFEQPTSDAPVRAGNHSPPNGAPVTSHGRQTALYSHDLRILMYSSGLGGAGRTLAIASHLSNACPGSSCLVLTDVPVFGLFLLPPNLDYIHLPDASEGEGGVNEPASRLQLGDTVLAIRRNIILATVESFDPHLVIVDGSPLELRNEMHTPLVRLRERHPGAKTILGLWDIPGDAGVIQTAWEEAGIEERA